MSQISKTQCKHFSTVFHEVNNPKVYLGLVHLPWLMQCTLDSERLLLSILFLTLLTISTYILKPQFTFLISLKLHYLQHIFSYEMIPYLHRRSELRLIPICYLLLLQVELLLTGCT